MKAIRAAAIGICAAISIGVVPRAFAADAVINVTTDVDTVYTPVRNEVVTRLPLPATAVPELDTLKLQVQNGITSGITTGKLTEDEAVRLYALLDSVQAQEAEFKLAGLTEGHINNLMRKYHMISQETATLASNTATNDFMPNFENRRELVMRRILYNMAAANLTPGEGEELLTALNQIGDNYAIASATGLTLTADELEAAHKDLFKLHNKLREKTSGFIAFVVPATVPERQEYLKKIQYGIATKQLSPAEGAKLIDGYNKLVLLESSLVANEGPRSIEIENLAHEINNMTFILDRQLRDRTTHAVAGSSNRL
jgi:hypothetical protein